MNGIKNSITNFFKGKNEESTGFQGQEMIDAQKIVQLQDQDIRNFTLGGLLSCLETIAYRYDQKLVKKYDGYNPKSIQEEKTIDQLVTQLQIESKAFRIMYDVCLDEYNFYWFPDNLKKEDIINDIQKWKTIIPGNLKVYYDNIINLFKENFDEIYFPKFKRNANERATCNPNLQIKLIPPNIAYINLRRKLVKKKYLKDGSFDNNLKLNFKDHCDSAFEKMNQRYKKILEKHNEYCNCEVCMSSLESLL